VIETELANVRGPVIQFRYRVLRGSDQTLICEGETIHVVVGRDMKRRMLPEKYAGILTAGTSDNKAEFC